MIFKNDLHSLWRTDYFWSIEGRQQFWMYALLDRWRDLSHKALDKISSRQQIVDVEWLNFERDKIIF